MRRASLGMGEDKSRGCWCRQRRHPPRRRSKHFKRLKIREAHKHATNVIRCSVAVILGCLLAMLHPLSAASYTKRARARRNVLSRVYCGGSPALLVRRGGLTVLRSYLLQGSWVPCSGGCLFGIYTWKSGCSDTQHVHWSNGSSRRSDGQPCRLV
jgi:hypothetical protein